MRAQMRLKTIVVACGVVGIIVVAMILYFARVQPVNRVKNHVIKTFKVGDVVYSTESDYYLKALLPQRNSTCVLIGFSKHFRGMPLPWGDTYWTVTYCPESNNTFALDHLHEHIYGRVFTVLNIDLGNKTITLSWIEER